MIMQISGLLLLARKKIADDADILLCHILNKPRAFLYAHPEFSLTKKQAARLAFLIKQRGRGIPLAYVTGHKEFFGLDFAVNKNVLIPRPESELLVEQTLQHPFVTLSLPKCGKRGVYNRTSSIADIGTGSGCLAVALAKNCGAKIFATDISAAALAVAKRNARRHCVAGRIKLLRGDLAAPLARKKIDVIVANLPYLDKRWRTNSIKNEPARALYARERGLALIKKLFRQLAARRGLTRTIILEFDPRQTAALKKIAAVILPQYSLKIIKDLAGRDRVAKLQLTS